MKSGCTDAAKLCIDSVNWCLSKQTFLECVRLRTFGRYGLQQIQVDTHYLQLYLWRFVADEKYAFCAVVIISEFYLLKNISFCLCSVVLKLNLSNFTSVSW